MEKVSTVDFKAHLGKYLGLVREGQTVYITSHRRSVARLAPVKGRGTLPVKPAEFPSAHLKTVKGIRPASGVDGVKALMEDRGRR